MPDVTTVVFDTNRLDYIQRVYDGTLLENNTVGYEAGYLAGMEFIILQLNLPIRIRH